MVERTIIEVEATDPAQLKRSPGIPEDDIYVELAPGVELSCSDGQLRRGADLLPYVVEFVLTVSSGVTTALILKLIDRFRQGGGQTVTIVKRHKINISIVEEETVEKIQKLIAEKEVSDTD